jgi:hypothetical protein
MEDNNLGESNEEIMDIEDRNALIKCRKKIIKDLDVRVIIDSLIETKVVDQVLYEKIKSEVIFGVWGRAVRHEILKFCSLLKVTVFANVKDGYKFLPNSLHTRLILRTLPVCDDFLDDR